jgi:hypothetical protein
VTRGQEIETSGCKNPSVDKYSMAKVSAALKMAKSGGWWSFEQTDMENIGDGVSIAVLKLTKRSELLAPEFDRAYLVLAKAAFAKPENTLCEADRRPDVTLLLLDYIRDHTSDSKLATEIDSVKDFVLSRTSTELAEPSK